MTRVPCIVLLLAAGTASAKSPAPQVVFDLVRDHHAVASVVVAGSDESLLAAVGDLRVYAERISGASLSISFDGVDTAGPTLHIGATEHYAQTADARARVLHDGFAMVALGEDLVLAGNTPQGSAHAVTTVLQDHFGVRWYHEGSLWTMVPSAPTLSIRFAPSHGASARVVNPAFIGRSLWSGGPEKNFARRMRLTLPGTQRPYVGAGHSLDKVVAPDKYMASHPEYFALVDGKRSADHPCFTHPDMFDVFMVYVRDGGSSFGVNDNTTVCRCETCLAVDGKSPPYHGMPNVSESYCQLMARVAAQTAAEFPGRRLGIFAYQITNIPPKTVKHLGNNLDVLLCQDTSQYFDAAYRKADEKMTVEWVTKAGHVSFYDYLGIDYWTPRYFPSILARQLRHLKTAGVVGYQTHDACMIDSAMPMYYLLYQMLWDVDIDAERTVSAMIDDLYAEAAAPIHAYYRHWEDCWERQKKGVWFFGMDNFRGEMEIYTWADMERGRQLLDEAEALAVAPEVKQRLAFLTAQYEYTQRAAYAYVASMEAITAKPPADARAAQALAERAVAAWNAYADVLETHDRLPAFPPGGWISKPFRVRAWALKRQLRDAVTAPMIRWLAANETKLSAEQLESAEARFTGAAQALSAAVEARVNHVVDAQPRPPRAFGLQADTARRAAQAPPFVCHLADWDASRSKTLDWWFRQETPGYTPGKYDEPGPEFLVPAPAAEDQSAYWQAVWDKQGLWLRVVVNDQDHVQLAAPPDMWQFDSVQLALDPRRDNLEYPVHSWTYLFGGYQGEELEFGLTLRDDRTITHIWQAPTNRGKPSRAALRAAARRHDGVTVYEAFVDWALLPGFQPAAQRSLGIAVLVNDVDRKPDGGTTGRRSAGYGGGLVFGKRPQEFAALRLAP